MQYKYNKNTDSLELVNKNSIIVNNAISSGTGVTLTVTTDEEDFYGKTVNLTDGNKIITSQFSNEGIAVFNNIDMEGALTASVEYEGDTYETAVNIQSHYDTELEAIPKVYGVLWDGSESTAWNRTDDALNFEEPIAAINGGDGSSPFDTIYPWSEMKIVEDVKGGTLVKIPKFYFKWTLSDSSLKLQISKKQLDGFDICPACANRDDGKGERDFVYVGRYLSSSLNYKSTVNVTPKNNITRATARTGISGLDNSIWQYDMYIHTTIWMLYLVEYANWDLLATIGPGTAGYGPHKTGGTDSMIYHTGTMSPRRDDWGRVQYRHIEDLWGNIGTWIDCLGFYYGKIGSSMFNNVRITRNPNQMVDDIYNSYIPHVRDNGDEMRYPWGGDYAYVKNVSVQKGAGGYSGDNYEQWLIFPKEMTSQRGYTATRFMNTSEPTDDSGYRVASTRGQISDKYTNGLFNIDASNDKNYASNYIGCRVVKLP